MTKVFKSNFFFASLVLALAVVVSITTNASAAIMLSSNGTSTVTSTTTSGALPYGCDLSVGTVYSPMTGESCSINGVTITPPIVMMPPYDANGCKPGGPYSMTTGITCPGATPASPVYTSTSDNCPTGTNCTKVLPLDCMTAKNVACATTVMTGTPTTSVSSKYANDVCIDGTIKRDVDSKGRPYCTKTIDGVVKTMPTLALPMKVSSTDDMRAVQKALNSALKDKLSTSISTDGKHGPRTKAAIKMFQKSVGLKADGFIGPRTLEKLKASFQ